MAKKKQNSKEKSKNKKKNSFDFKLWVFVIAAIAMLVAFFASSLLLLVGMLPTLIALVVVSKNHKNKALTIGAMNFSGCFIYLLEIWQSNDRMSSTIEILSDPMSTVIMYGAAGVGYIINWGVTNFVRQIMYSTAEAKIRSLENEKKKLIERWGEKVTGEIVLDINGFPLLSKKEKEEQEKA